MACGYFSCSRNALISLNILYFLIAILLVGVAIYAKFINYVSSIAVIGAIIGCGVFLILISCMGFIGAVKHHQICLFFYMVVLFLLFLVQFSLAVALLAITPETQQDLATKGWHSASNVTKEDIMKDLNCCGFQHWDLSEPSCSHIKCCQVMENRESSCCGGRLGIPCKCGTCDTKIEKYSDTACKITGGVGLFISLTEIAGVWLSVRYRNQKDPRADPNAFL